MALFTGKAVKTIERYITALNSHDSRTLSSLIGDNACFVDSCGDALDGHDVIYSAMEKFFTIEPDYKLHANEISEFRGEVLIRGSVEAIDPDLQHDTLWRARTDLRTITYWQSYADGSGLALARALAPDAARRVPAYA